jgi:6-pyruvoyltetrahydropterin/6-carboxytetrahydropterin synthase
MYTVSIEAGFCALHRVLGPDGRKEPPHGHDWVARAIFVRRELGSGGMVVDFERAHEALQSVVKELHHTDLNRHEAFGNLNPTAEVVARHVYERLRALGLGTIRRVEVAESPGCVAAYEPRDSGERVE